MRKNMSGLMIAVFMMSFWFTACKPKTKTSTENNIQWDSIHVEKNAHLLENPNNPNCNLQIHFTFPVRYENRELLEVMQQHFIRSYYGEPYEGLSPAQATERYAEDYLAEYKTLEKDWLAEHEKNHEHKEEITEAWYSYYEFFSNEIKYNKNGFLCYAVSYENYTGGAHGAHSYKNYILDLETGVEVTEADFFVEGYQNALAKILVDKITGKNRVENAKELENIGYFSIDEIYPNGNFSVDDAGITYYFNEYEIAAYVMGITSVDLPYGEIRHLLRSDGRIALLTGNR
jgi:hypothetical protein